MHCSQDELMTKNRQDLEPNMWYVCNINSQNEGAQGIGVSAGRKYFDHVVSPGFATEGEAHTWLNTHPEFQGPYAQVLQFRR